MKTITGYEVTRKGDKAIYADGAWYWVFAQKFLMSLWFLTDWLFKLTFWVEGHLCEHRRSVSGSTASKKIVCNDCGMDLAPSK